MLLKLQVTTHEIVFVRVTGFCNCNCSSVGGSWKRSRQNSIVCSKLRRFEPEPDRCPSIVMYELLINSVRSLTQIILLSDCNDIRRK